MQKKIISSLVVLLMIGAGVFPVLGRMKNEKISDINNEPFESDILSSDIVNYTVGTSETIVVTLNAGEYNIKIEGGYSEVEMDDFGSILNPGKPKLPYKTFLVGLPPGGEVISVEVIDMEMQEIPGSYDIVTVPSFVGAEGVVKDPTYGTFSGDEVYPGQAWKYLGMGQMRKYDFARISVYPMSYGAKDGNLVLYENITLKIDYEIVKEVSNELLADCFVITQD